MSILTVLCLPSDKLWRDWREREREVGGDFRAQASQRNANMSKYSAGRIVQLPLMIGWHLGRLGEGRLPFPPLI